MAAITVRMISPANKKSRPILGRAFDSRGTTQIDLRRLVFAVSGEPVGFLIRRSRAEQLCFAAASHHPAAFCKLHTALLFLSVRYIYICTHCNTSEKYRQGKYTIFLMRYFRRLRINLELVLLEKRYVYAHNKIQEKI